VSIYGSLPAPCDDEHEDDCGKWDKRYWQLSKRDCTCGQPNAPMVYMGSHVLPSPSDTRGGWVDIASIAGFITRDGRDGGGEHLDYDTPWPYLRFGVNEATVVLTEENVRQIADTLNEWLALPKVKEPAAPVVGVPERDSR